MRPYGSPVLVGTGAKEMEYRLLAQVPYRPVKGDDSFDERWIQNLVDKFPTVLPIAKIESAVDPVAAVCKELVVASSSIDNLLVSPRGDIVIVECKLWRNAEARRKVVAQILEYAKDLAKLGYSSLNECIARARHLRDFDLYAHMRAEFDGRAEVPEEAEFIDSISANLRKGRILLLIVGDGITEEAEQLVEYLQDNSTLHYTFGLIELSVWQVPGGDRLVMPRVVVQTRNLVRGIVEIRQSEAGSPVSPVTVKAPPKEASPQSNSESGFYEELDRALPGAARKLSSFVDQIALLGVKPDLKAALSLKWRNEDDQVFSLGLVDRLGRVYFDGSRAALEKTGLRDVLPEYLRMVAGRVPGAIPVGEPYHFNLLVNGKTITIDRLLDDPNVWREAMETAIEMITKATEH